MFPDPPYEIGETNGLWYARQPVSIKKQPPESAVVLEWLRDMRVVVGKRSEQKQKKAKTGWQ